MTPRLQALLDRLESLIGPVAVNQIVEEGPEVLYAQLETLDAHEASIENHLTREMAGVVLVLFAVFFNDGVKTDVKSDVARG